MIRSRTRDSVLRLLALAVALACAASAGLAADTPPPSRTAPSAGAPAQPLYDGTPVGVTAEGYPYRGDPKAPVTLEEFSDYLCPYCARHAQQTLHGLVEQYVRTGKLRYVFRDFPVTELHPGAAAGAAAARCVAEQGPVLFWKMHDELFRRQSDWNRLPDPSKFLAAVAAQVGADKQAYETCMASPGTLAAVDRSVARAVALGFIGTPSFEVYRTQGGEAYKLLGARPPEVFTQWVDALLTGHAPPHQAKHTLPLWASAAGLAPDPGRPGFTRAGDPYKGDPKAKLKVVEFTDFQSASCKRQALQIQPGLDQDFVQTGQVFWVVKNLPSQIHRNALSAATAAECAGEQGKFWNMYRLLFERQDQWSEGDPDKLLPALADSLGLDRGRFDRCFNGRKGLERVVADLYDARSTSVRSAPAFIFLYGGTAVLSQGGESADRFRQLLQSRYELATGSGTGSDAKTAP